jgi:N,N'-diacetyllegionaminate synthase
MRIGPVDLARKVLVVAEVGNNHEGKLDVARELVRRAAEAGADAVKFQTFRTRYFVSAADRARFERLAGFELTPGQFQELCDLARSVGLLFVSTPLDLESAAVLEPLVDCYKVASGDNNFYPLLERICRTGKPLIVSTGLADLAQVRRTVRFVQECWRAGGIAQELAVLHCVSSYPVPPEQANVAAVRTLARELPCPVGYSDHTIGIQACLAAVALGARIVEKHFTLDKRFSDFRDHQLSADPLEMAELVRRVAEIGVLLGTGEKVLQPNEVQAERLIRRSIVAAADLAAGHTVRSEDLTWIRPWSGLAPGEEGQVVGRRLRRALAFGEPIRPADLE